MAVFPPDKIQSITGVKNNVHYINVDKILDPIKSFLPAETVEDVMKSEDTKTEFVKERMEEIAAAIDQDENDKENNENKDVEDISETLDSVKISEEDSRNNQDEEE